MSDEQAPDEVQDTPTEDATLNEDTAHEQPPENEEAVEETTDWQKRYHDLQPEYTRATQRVKELEPLADWKPLLDDLSNPETRQQALEWLNGQFSPEDGEGEDGDLDEGFYDPRVDMLLEREQQRELDVQFGEFEKHLSGLIEEKNLQLTDRQRKALASECIEAGFSPDATRRVVDEWATELSSTHDEIIKQYVEGKRKQPPPAVKRGASGTEHVPLDTEQKRRERALQIANEAFAD